DKLKVASALCAAVAMQAHSTAAQRETQRLSYPEAAARSAATAAAAADIIVPGDLVEDAQDSSDEHKSNIPTQEQIRVAKERRERARARATNTEDYIALDQDVTGGVAAPSGHDDEPEEVRQPTLFDPQRTEADMEVDDEGYFTDPLEYGCKISNEDASCLISIGIGPDSKVYMAADLILSGGDHEAALGDQYPHKSGDGFKTITEAVKAGIGKLIDRAIKNDVAADIIDDLRDELKRLDNGGEPMEFPKDEA
ncbi:MAG: hypothetical protein ACOYNK_06320, partial [Microbacteriaceae bacterium]